MLNISHSEEIKTRLILSFECFSNFIGHKFRYAEKGEKKKLARSIASNDTRVVHCTCGAIDDDREMMVECDGCKVWKHIVKCGNTRVGTTFTTLRMCFRILSVQPAVVVLSFFRFEV